MIAIVEVAIRVGTAVAAAARAAAAVGASAEGVAEAVAAVAEALAAVARPRGVRPPVQFFIGEAQLDSASEADTTSLHNCEVLAQGLSDEVNLPPEVTGGRP